MRAFAFCLFALIAAETAIAGDADARVIVQHIFESADRDGDGNLTESEYQEAALQRFGVSFAESDENADGVTSLAEYLHLYDKHHTPVDRRDA